MSTPTQEQHFKIFERLGGRKAVALLLGLALVVCFGAGSIAAGADERIVSHVITGIVALTTAYIVGNAASHHAYAWRQRGRYHAPPQIEREEITAVEETEGL